MAGGRRGAGGALPAGVAAGVGEANVRAAGGNRHVVGRGTRDLLLGQVDRERLLGIPPPLWAVHAFARMAVPAACKAAVLGRP